MNHLGKFSTYIPPFLSLPKDLNFPLSPVSISFPYTNTDVGYDGISPVVGLVNNVLNIYFHEYFPRAAQISHTLRSLNDSAHRMIYTTHAWLVSMYLDCPSNMVLSGNLLQCPSAGEVAVFEEAVRNGDIVWHR